ncbi:MAG: cellulase family glycosylhydrolase [Oscillospiraceae bacterium]|nr:cellulase family glycosylhydrolase [Oscillospiraceae bacterium]
MISGCAASESSNSSIDTGSSGVSSADIRDSAASDDSDGASGSESGTESTAPVNTKDNSSESETAAPSESGSDSTAPLDTESDPEAGASDSSRAPEDNSSVSERESGSVSSVPPAASPEPSEEAPADKPHEGAEGFYVSGTKLYDANGNEFVMRGINHPHSWFKDKDDIALAAIAETGANCVRIVCGDGQQYARDSAETLSRLVERCKALEMIAILEVHDITGKDELSALEKTVDYWIEVKDALIGNEAYVLLNIANEWVGTWDSDIWTQGYTAAIPRLREAGIKNTIIVDAAGWGQYAKSISDGGEEVFAADPLQNTMFSIHMYGSAGKNDRVIRQNLARVTEKGLCVIVGEFGYNHSDGDVDEAFIMQYCGENDIGYLGWSWKGNGGGVEYLDIALEWDGSRLSEEWGVNLIEGDTGIRKTSEKCSVFE